MAEPDENEETANLRPACLACAHHCMRIHGDRNPDTSWPFFRKKMSKLALHQTPQAGICIPGAFMEDYPNTVQKGKFITLEGPSGNKWRVGAIEKLLLHPGWRAFAHDNDLQEGDVLDFKLTKPSHFVVDIFNSKGDVRRSACHARVTGKYSVGRSRKRKEPTVADQRCKITTKRGCHDPALGPKLRYCQKTKQWERQDAREVHLGREDDEEIREQQETESNPLRQFTKVYTRRPREAKPKLITLENVRTGVKTSDELTQRELEFMDPENRALIVKPDTESACVLISRRGQVMQSDRDKAQAWVKKLPKACFIAVMNPTRQGPLTRLQLAQDHGWLRDWIRELSLQLRVETSPEEQAQLQDELIALLALREEFLNVKLLCLGHKREDKKKLII